MPRPVGIDLGTTYSVVATIEGGRTRILPNAESQSLTPSVVAFIDGGEPLVGDAAKRQAAANPDRTVFSIKRRMGSRATVRIGGRDCAPEDISSLILRKLKADAERHLREPIDRAVITVPAYFNDRQRQATKDAAMRAGLEVLRLLNEPTSAALAYGLEREDAHTVLVWDLGGGTFDVSILELGEGIYEVKAVSGDNHLGGDDFDLRVMDYVVGQYARGQGADFPAAGGARQRLREAAEAGRIALSTADVAAVRVPLGDAPDADRFEVEITRSELDSLTADLRERMAAATRQAFSDAGLSPKDIDRVLLVGGATRTPAVRELVRQITGKEPYRYIDPDLVVAAGAAIHAGMLLGVVEKVALLDVVPLSLGVETQGGLTARIIPRNTPLPASEGHVFTTAAADQTSMDIHILQGERELAVDNVSLGRLELDGLPPLPKGACKVEVGFDVDVDGVVHVSARELATEREVAGRIVSTKLLDRAEIELLAAEARRGAAADRRERERIEATIAARNLIGAAEVVLGDTANPPLPEDAQGIARAVAALEHALASGGEGIGAATADLRSLLADASRRARGVPRRAARAAVGQAEPGAARAARANAES